MKLKISKMEECRRLYRGQQTLAHDSLKFLETTATKYVQSIMDELSGTFSRYGFGEMGASITDRIFYGTNNSNPHIGLEVDYTEFASHIVDGDSFKPVVRIAPKRGGKYIPDKEKEIGWGGSPQMIRRTIEVPVANDRYVAPVKEIDFFLQELQQLFDTPKNS